MSLQPVVLAGGWTQENREKVYARGLLVIIPLHGNGEPREICLFKHRERGSMATEDEKAARDAVADSPRKTADDKQASLVESAYEKVRKDADASGVSRRGLFIGVGGAAVLLALGGLRYAGHTPLCHPPGGQNEAHLVSACIRCQRCIEACPRHVLVPAHIEDGLLGMRAPTFDFDDSYCDFCQEANGGSPRCVEVCPSGALALPEGATPQNTIMGRAVIDTSTCLAYRDTGCRFCYDACPYEAIQLTDDKNTPKPSVLADLCNGCGACESVCVSLKAASIASNATERAIKVRPVEG